MNINQQAIAPSRHYFIHTFGCQMNEVDSLRLSESLQRMGYLPASSAEEADLILLNTCAVREKAEQKVLSALGRYRLVKAARGALIGVAGCVAQQEKEALLKKVPYIDFLLGPDAVASLPQILERVENQHRRVAQTDWIDAANYVFPRAEAEQSRGKAAAFVTVMKGCNHVCSYCVVPFVRGREHSRPVDEVLSEVRALAEVGVREVTLIGQNVNSYDGGVDFYELLARVCAVDSLARVRFTTSNPCDLPDRLIDAFGTLPKLMPHFHLPVQSGSDRVLEMMRRGHSVAHYIERIERLRRVQSAIALTTDLIVGFPSETEEDFCETMALVERARFDNVYSFVYSPRPHTVAARRQEEWGVVPQSVKAQRLKRLQERVRTISLENAKSWVGKKVEVLVEGPSKTDASRLYGRNPQNRVVNFEGRASAGLLAEVQVDSATANALFGKEC